MKKILFLLLLASCAKPQEQLTISKQITHAVVISEVAVFDPSKTPDLAPIDLIKAYEGYLIGIRSHQPNLFTNFEWNGEISNWLQFYCPVGNFGVTSAEPWSPLVWTGTNYSGADLTWTGTITEGMLYTAIFQNGLPVSVKYKERWEGTDGDHLPNYNPDLDNRTYLWYPTDYNNVFHAMFSDTYYNWQKLPVDALGKYVVVVTYNPENELTHQRLFKENDYSNNTVAEGFNVLGANSAVWDSTAITENVPRPIGSIGGKFNVQGKKYVFLQWLCPYEGTGVIHKHRIKREDGKIFDNIWEEEYTDYDVKGSFKSSNYSIEVKIEGLGISPARTITVNRK